MSEKCDLTAKVMKQGLYKATIHVRVDGGLTGILTVDVRHADQVAGLIDNAEELLETARAVEKAHAALDDCSLCGKVLLGDGEHNDVCPVQKITNIIAKVQQNGHDRI